MAHTTEKKTTKKNITKKHLRALKAKVVKSKSDLRDEIDEGDVNPEELPVPQFIEEEVDD